MKSIYHKTEPGLVVIKPQSPTTTSSNKDTKLQNSHMENLNLIIRKNAHAFEYMGLAILTCNAFFINKFKGKGAIIYVLFICLFYAVTD